MNLVLPDGTIKRNVTPAVAELLKRSGARELILQPINLNIDETRRSAEGSGVLGTTRPRRPRGSKIKVRGNVPAENGN